jgi:hypothetical protein
MGKNAIIFLHPTLRNLTISCFDIGKDLEAYLSSNPKQTLLKSLTFDECNITVEGLATILSIPKALERLTLGERKFHLLGYTHAPLGRSPALLLQALSLQQDSLQYLKHIGGSAKSPILKSHCSGLSLSSFLRIREMELCADSILTQILSSSTTPWSATIPPNLHLLRYLQSFSLEPDQTPTDLELLPNMLYWISYIGIPQLDYVLDCYDREDRNSILSDLLNEHLKPTWKKIFALVGAAPSDEVEGKEKRKVDERRRLRILVVRGSVYIPPYMYGEEQPGETVIFDSEHAKGKNMLKSKSQTEG